MIKCKSKAEFEIQKLKYFILFGSVLYNEKKRIIYLPEDEIYKNIKLNYTEKKRNEKNS